MTIWNYAKKTTDWTVALSWALHLLESLPTVCKNKNVCQMRRHFCPEPQMHLPEMEKIYACSKKFVYHPFILLHGKQPIITMAWLQIFSGSDKRAGGVG